MLQVITDKGENELWRLLMDHIIKDRTVEIAEQSQRVEVPKERWEGFDRCVDIMHKAIARGQDLSARSADALFNLCLDKKLLSAKAPIEISSRHLIYQCWEGFHVGFNITPAGTFTDLHHGSSIATIG
jgi:hypothetical protein